MVHSHLRHSAILLVKLLCVFALPAAAQNAPPTERPPNIVFVFTDDHASRAISAYGSVINETPEIDRLAGQGMRFDRCLVTNSICGPSRATILTGKYSHRNGFFTHSNTFDGTQTTFPKLLQAAGYQTAIIGKWHLKSDPTGFDHWNILVGQGFYYNPRMVDNGEPVEYKGYATDLITDLAIDWIDETRDRGRPFMLMVQHKAPHRPFRPGPEHLTLYDDVEIPEPATLFDDYAGRGTAATMQEMTIAKDLNANDLKLVTPTRLNDEQRAAWEAAYGPKNQAFHEADLTGADLVRWKYQRYIKDYLRCVASVDDNVGRLMAHLEDAGLAENTVVIYASDQGWFLGEHGWYDKRWMYEPSLRTPLIVRWPGVTEPGASTEALVSNLDFAQTFLDIAGVESPNDMQGRSLVPLLRGETPDDWRDSFYYHYYAFPAWHAVRRHYGVRTERHKLIHFYNLGEWEMYDLEADPDEMTSVYGDPAYAEIQAELHTELDRLREHYGVAGDPTPPVPENPRIPR